MRAKNKLMFFSVLILLFFMITGVSATDNITFDEGIDTNSNINESNTTVTTVNLVNNTTINNTYYHSSNANDTVVDNTNVKLDVNNLSVLSSVNDTNNIYISPNGLSDAKGSLEDPTNWETAYQKIANNGGTIYFSSGTYNKIVNDIITKNITLYHDTTDGEAILNGELNGYIIYNTGNLNIIGLTFVNATDYNNEGGAIYSNGTLNISKSKFIRNNAGKDGGAIYSNGEVTIINSSFINNTAMEGSGGAIFINFNSNLKVHNSSFINNTAINGGSININFADNVCISNCTLINNTAINGGAIYTFYSTIIIHGSSLINNTAINRGNAIYNELKNVNSDVSYNWWGNNTPFSDSNHGSLIYEENTYITPKNYLVLTFTLSDICIIANLNTTNTGSTYKTIIVRPVTFSGTIAPYITTTGIYVFNYGSIVTVNITVDNQIITVTVPGSIPTKILGNVSYNISLLTSQLSLNMSRWSYDIVNNIYYQLNIVYCINPSSIFYESLGIYVPGEYFNGIKNNEGFYTCTLNYKNNVGNYNVKTAPIIMPINTLGYAANPAPTSYNNEDVKNYINAGFVYVLTGCRGRSNGFNFIGNAPWGVTDLKAAVNYLRFNNDTIPGNTDRIFTLGMSGGGAQSALMGATGDSTLYNPYLESIGSAMIDKNGLKISNSVCGSMCWCPVIDLGYVDEAYEWNMGQYSHTGTRAENLWTSFLSKDLATEFALHINQLCLKSPNGTILTLNQTNDGIYTSGTYYDYIMLIIEESLNNYLNDTNFQETSYGSAKAYIDSLNNNREWIIYNNQTNTVNITNMEAFVKNCKEAIRPVGSSDNLNCNNPENDLFGVVDDDFLHFDTIIAKLLIKNSNRYSEYDNYNSIYTTEYNNDLKKLDILNNTIATRENMYNPMYYLCNYYNGYKSSNVAKYWRISSGINQRTCALTVETNLALALQQYTGVKRVEFQTVWNQGHVTAERNGDPTTNFINWVNSCLNT